MNPPGGGHLKGAIENLGDEPGIEGVKPDAQIEGAMANFCRVPTGLGRRLQHAMQYCAYAKLGGAAVVLISGATLGLHRQCIKAAVCGRWAFELAPCFARTFVRSCCLVMHCLLSRERHTLPKRCSAASLVCAQCVLAVAQPRTGVARIVARAARILVGVR